MSLVYSSFLVTESILLSLTLNPIIRLSYYPDLPPAVAFQAQAKRQSRDVLNTAIFSTWLLTGILVLIFFLPECAKWLRRWRTWKNNTDGKDWKKRKVGKNGIGDGGSGAWMGIYSSFVTLKFLLLLLIVNFLSQVAFDAAALAKEASFQSPSYNPNPPDRYPLNSPVDLALALSTAADFLSSALTAATAWTVAIGFELLSASFTFGIMKGRKS